MNVHGLGDAREPPQGQTAGPAMAMQVPLVCKGVAAFALVMGVVGLFAPLSAYLANTVEDTVFGLQLWRLATAPLVPDGFISALLTALLFVTAAAPIELVRGSTTFLWIVFVGGWAIQVIYASVMLVLGTIASSLWIVPSQGFWPSLFILLVLESNRSPEQERNVFCCPFQLKAKYHPYLLACILQLLQIASHPLVDIAAGLLLGELAVRSPSLLPSSALIARFESKAVWLASKSSYVTDDKTGFSMLQESDDVEMQSSERAAAPVQPSGTGHRLGSFSDPSGSLKPGAGHVLAQQATQDVESVEYLVSMGYGRSKAIRALQDADGDVDEAVEQLSK